MMSRLYADGAALVHLVSITGRWRRGLGVLCLLTACLLAVGGAAAAHAQTPPVQQQALGEVPNKRIVPATRLPSNFIRVLDAQGDTLWIGPLLFLTTDGGASFRAVDDEALTESASIVFSLDVQGSEAASTIWAGLAFDAGGGAPAAGGFLVSTDGGQSFAFRPPPLDDPSDRTITYGVSTLPALPVTQATQSAPQDIGTDAASGTVWSANGLAGLRRSTDGGQTWTRIVLPPDSLDVIAPDILYDFRVAPFNNNQGFLNYFGNSVLVDAAGTVWAGTAAGVNRSTLADVDAAGERAWRRFAFDGTPARLTGNSVAELAEQPLEAQRNPVWMATWPSVQLDGVTGLQRFGVTVTRDGGETFEQTLVGEQIYAFAFRGERVYAAGENGVFISDDGTTWRAIRNFTLDDDQVLSPNASPRAAAVTPDALWVGTTAGLLRSTDEGQTWRLFQTSAPVNPDDPTERTPDVATYAYPNPFSPAADGIVRIRYELDAPGRVEVRIFDFGMNLVRTLVSDQSAGQQETVWDGVDRAGVRVANGPYFYTVDLGDEVVRGKILILE